MTEAATYDIEALRALKPTEKAFHATGLAEAWGLALLHRDAFGQPTENMPHTLLVPPQMHFPALHIVGSLHVERAVNLTCLYAGQDQPRRWYLVGSKTTLAFDWPWTTP